MAKINTYALTITGRRKNNQDTCIALQTNNLIFLAVADGMGGARGGEIASQAVIDVAKIVLSEVDQEKINPEKLKDTLQKIFADSHERLSGIISEKKELTGMGTTLSCVLLYNDKYVWGNIGDSRVYLYNGTQLRQITTDHSFIEEYRKQYGNDIPEFIKARSNVITRSLGGENDEPDIYPAEKPFTVLNEGEGFLICSDGLLTEKSDDESAWLTDYLLGTKNLKSAAENMICHAFYQGSSDNISVVLCEHGRFKRKKLKIQKYTYPPVEKPVPTPKPGRKKKNLRLLLSLLILILLGISMLFVTGVLNKDMLFKPEKKEDPAIIRKETDIKQETRQNLVIDKDWKPWRTTELRTYNISKDQIDWNPYNEAYMNFRVSLTQTASKPPYMHELKDFRLRFLEISEPIGLKPGNYRMKVDVVLPTGEILEGEEIEIKLVN